MAGKGAPTDARNPSGAKATEARSRAAKIRGRAGRSCYAKAKGPLARVGR